MSQYFYWVCQMWHQIWVVSNVQKSYRGILWKSSCILALASLPWHPCLNQCECISGREPSASLSTAASFIVCFCRQIREFDALTVTCEKYVCVHVFPVTHSFILYECVHVCDSVCGCLLYRETKTVWEGERKWMTQLKAIERSKARIKMSSIGRHVHVHAQTYTHTHTLEQGCIEACRQGVWRV